MIEVIDFHTLPTCLQQLPDEHKQQINDSLLNDEFASDEEMVAFWSEECGIAEDAARAAIGYRNQVLTTMFLHLFDPN